MKDVLFLGTSRDDLRAFPKKARRAAGLELGDVQSGLMPKDWKPMPSVGAGVIEIRIRVADGAFRVLYAAKFGDDVVVLHCFQKKSSQTSHVDIALSAKRYKAFFGRGK